jgi:ribosomal protein L21E
MSLSWNTPSKNKAKVEKELTTFGVGDLVKLVDAPNTRIGLDKNGRTGYVTRVQGNQIEVNLHTCTPNGHIGVSTFIEALKRHVVQTKEKQWFAPKQLLLIEKAKC